jgi:hypothetical protein
MDDTVLESVIRDAIERWTQLPSLSFPALM